MPAAGASGQSAHAIEPVARVQSVPFRTIRRGAAKRSFYGLPAREDVGAPLLERGQTIRLNAPQEHAVGGSRWVAGVTPQMYVREARLNARLDRFVADHNRQSYLNASRTSRVRLGADLLRGRITPVIIAVERIWIFHALRLDHEHCGVSATSSALIAKDEEIERVELSEQSGVMTVFLKTHSMHRRPSPSKSTDCTAPG